MADFKNKQKEASQLVTNFSDSRIVLPKLHKPLSFSALLALYESNYIQVMNFLKLGRKEIILGECAWQGKDTYLQCKVEELTKYTALLCFEEDIVEQNEKTRVNHIRVRLYHDALLAAVQSSLQSSDHYQLTDVPIDKSRITELWQQNSFFNKWLEFCFSKNLELLTEF